MDDDNDFDFDDILADYTQTRRSAYALDVRGARTVFEGDDGARIPAVIIAIRTRLEGPEQWVSFWFTPADALAVADALRAAALDD